MLSVKITVIAHRVYGLLGNRNITGLLKLCSRMIGEECYNAWREVKLSAVETEKLSLEKNLI